MHHARFIPDSTKAGLIGRWPGKSPVVPEGSAHPAIYHMLDVASVAEQLLAPFGLPTAQRGALVLLVALHDIGKIGVEFRSMLESGVRQSRRHWEVTEALMLEHEDWLATRFNCSHHVLRPLIAASAGHHGRPPSATADHWVRMLAAAGAEALADAAVIMRLFAECWPNASLAGLDSRAARRLSWWLSGLTVTADWVGSNPNWFPPRAPDLSIEDYLALTRRQAEAAVTAAGLAPLRPSGRMLGFSAHAEMNRSQGGCSLIRRPVPRACGDKPLFDFTLRPMQTAASEIDLPPGPTLAILEDETGAGKTESAFILAQRMLRAGKASGLYFALPTMATADSMFARAIAIVGRLFEGTPTLTLAHGRSALSAAFRDVVGRAPESDDVTCTAWLADSRRRALLAHVGIGTIDQALLAVLPTRFATLRLFALSSRILIVDEVHEMGEPYMQEELIQLLHAHAARGASAILLTATLPQAQRQRLVEAFESGAGRIARRDDNPAYPSLSIAGGAARRAFPQTVSPKGSVAVRRLETAEAAVELLAASVTQDASCIWVRNAVDDAIAAVEMLRTRGVPADLLHARFALCDRKRIEKNALGVLGKDGSSRRPGVLVGTQVLESSLDLDADVMISDLAPMAALIQRAGRLWRHMDVRPATSRPVGAPVLHVVSPDPAQVHDGRWLHRVLDRGAWVYPVDVQWRTADVLFRAGEIVAPFGLRQLIEAVHGEQPYAVPQPLLDAEAKRLGADAAKASRGRQNTVTLDAGFRSSAGFDDIEFPTRLGQPQRLLVLACNCGGQLVPWAGGRGVEAWMLSEVSASARRLFRVPLLDQSRPEIVAATKDWPEWKRRSVHVCEVATDGGIAEGLRYDPQLGLLFTSLEPNPETR